MFCPKSYGQQDALDSLRDAVRNNPREDTLKVIQLNELAYKSFSYDAKDLAAYSQQALLLARKLNYPRGEATAYKNLALSYMLIHGDVTALRYLEHSKRLFQALRDTVGLAGTVNYIGCYYATLKDYKQALPYFLKAEKLLGNRTHPIRLTILSNTGSCYEDLRQFGKAEKYYQRVKELAQAVKENDWVVVSYYHSASLLVARKKYETALKIGTEALYFINKQNISPRNVQAIHLLLGDINYQLGHYPRAREYYEKSAVLAQQMNSRENMATVYYKFHLLDSIAGNHASALQYFKRYQLITDSLLNENKNTIIALHKVRFALEEHESENKRLLLARSTDEKVIFYQRLVLFLTLISLAVVGISFFRLKNLHQKVRKSNQLVVQQNDQLEETNRVKDKLFSVVAHDLRGPFIQLINLLDMMENQLISLEELTDFLPALNKESRQTLDMMDNLLVWSKSQMNGFQLRPVELNLSALVQDTVEVLQVQIREKELRVVCTIPGSLVAWADRDMIRIVVRNLLVNAIKFTPQGGLIELKGYRSGSDVTLALHDTGVGMVEEQLTRLFSFKVESTPGTAHEKGTGLGLKIGRDLLDLNQGTIKVESTPGQGSTFYVKLPACQPQEESETVVSEP
ncbi:tetratricopeptide repeat protein [Rhabdobacter roseus]